jgi:hypothetical protein
VQEDGGLLDGGVGAEEGLDFAEFDAEAAEFNLLVEASQEEEGAVGEPADEVAGAVEAGGGVGGEGVREEVLGGEGGLAEVAGGEGRAADEEFAGDADGDGLEGGIEDIEGAVRERVADGSGGEGIRGGAEMDGSPDGGFGGAVFIEEGGLG